MNSNKEFRMSKKQKKAVVEQLNECPRVELEMKLIDLFEWMDNEEVYQLFYDNGCSSSDPFSLRKDQVMKMHEVLDAKKRECKYPEAS